jgi:two-component system LytT family response regulator
MKLFIIEDDQWSKKTIEVLIKSFFPDVKIVGTAENVEYSIKLINKTKPDFILADVQLGEENVFEIMKGLDDAWNYNFVLTTSYENYALEAISNEVVDYIVKPVTIENLTLAINKVRRKLNYSNNSNPDATFGKGDSRILGLSSMDKIEVINLDAIVYVQADGRYTHFFLLDGSRKTASKNLGEYEKILPKEDFLRVHHSYIVNMNYVKSILKTDGYFVKLFKTESLIPVAKRKQEIIVKFLKLKV